MYGCYDGIMVYGFSELDSDSEIADEYIDEYIKEFNDKSVINLGKFATSLVRNHNTCAVYGIVVSIDPKSGTPSITESEKSSLKMLYDRVSVFKKYSEIKFMLVVFGDYETDMTQYIPGYE
jgi:hypothetical protein